MILKKKCLPLYAEGKKRKSHFHYSASVVRKCLGSRSILMMHGPDQSKLYGDQISGTPIPVKSRNRKRCVLWFYNNVLCI